MGHDQQQLHAKGGESEAAIDLDAKREHEALAKDWEWVKAYADGKHSQNDLGTHIAELGGWVAEAVKLMPKIAKRTNGDIVIECAAKLGMSVVDQIKLAQHARTPIGADSLREHLRVLSADTLAELDQDPDLIQNLKKKVLKGALAVELPVLAPVPSAIADKANIIEWYVETMNPVVGGLQLTLAGQAKTLAETLDKVAGKTPKAWGWLSAIQIQNQTQIGDGLLALKDETKNDWALQKLTALTKDYNPDVDQQTKQVPVAMHEFAHELEGKNDAAFLDAAARSQGEGSDNAKLPARLAGAPADTVLQYLFTISSMSAEDVKRSLKFLHDAKGTTAEHLTTFFSSVTANNIAVALVDDATRKFVRGIVGRGRGLHTLFPSETDEAAHVEIVKEEVLRQWAYEDDSPTNLLWLAAGSGPGAKLGCRLVKSEKGNDWVKKLPADANAQDLRRFAMNSTDAAAVKHIKSAFIHDSKHSIDPHENEVQATNGAVYGGTDTQGGSMTEQRPAIVNDEADPQIVLARLADLNATERKHILGKPDEVAKILGKTVDELRAVELLQPTIEQLASFPIKHKPELVDYTSTRSAAEQSAGSWQAATLHRVLGTVSPFIALPALKQPETLAKALDDNEELLDWILQETDASQALALLSRDPARKVVANLMSHGRHAYDGLPAYDQLRKQGRQGFDAIAKDIKDGDSKDEVADYKAGETTPDASVDKHATDVKAATHVGNLAANIDAIVDSGGSSADVIAVVQAATPSQQIDLLSGEHEKHVRRLRSHVKVGPQHVFPELSATQLLSLIDGASWLLGYSHATTVLHLIANDENAARALGKTAAKNYEVAAGWATELPRGGALTASERHALDDLAQHVKHDVLLHTLFEVRFDTSIGQNYSLDETLSLWSVLKRLPHAQVDQEVIKHITKQPLSGPVGQWGKPDIDLDTPRLTGNDGHYDDRKIWMTAAEVKKYYGLDDKALHEAADTKSKKQWLEFDSGSGLYKVKMTSPKLFDATVLHEVGHSVDTLLGEQTELVYKEGFAGWKRYGYDQFEEFGKEMGAFDNVDSTERKQIVEAWQQALRSKTAVNRLVGPEHPAVAKTSPLQHYADQDAPFQWNYDSLKPVNGRVFMQTPTALASITKQGWDAAPSDYAMTAPAEWFAECYVEYYCGYNGTKETEEFKGGRLPAWIKKWFAENVDNIRFSPDRVHQGMGESGDA